VRPSHGTYFEDITLGEQALTPGMTLTEAHAALYRGLTGDDAAEPGAIPDLLPLCLSTGLGWRMRRPPLVVLAFMGLEWTIHRALRVGDTVHGRARAAVKRSLRDGGVIVQAYDIVDQRGDVAQGGRFTFLVAKRAATPA
jgi:acyl dehydratase